MKSTAVSIGLTMTLAGLGACTSDAPELPSAPPQAQGEATGPAEPPVAKLADEATGIKPQGTGGFCTGNCEYCAYCNTPGICNWTYCGYFGDCCQGRPLLIDGSARVAPVEERDDWA